MNWNDYIAPFSKYVATNYATLPRVDDFSYSNLYCPLII